MSVPLSFRADVALRFATDNVAEVPLSVNVKRVFGTSSASLIVKTAFVPAVASAIVGVAFERLIGNTAEKVAVPEISASVTPESKPVFVIPPALLLTPPVIDAPPEVTVNKPPIV